MRLATFNTGLAEGAVKYVRERALLIPDAIARSDADVVCLQEVWLDRDYERLREDTLGRYPYAERPAPQVTHPVGGCSEGEIAPVLRCAQRSCRGAPERLGACMAVRCGHLASRLSLACAECLLEDPTRDVSGAAKECTARHSPPSSGSTSLDPPCPNVVESQTARTSPSGELAADTGENAVVYGGSYGLTLLSRPAPAAADFLRLPSTRVARGVIYARFVRTGRSPLHVFCTHLATPLPTSSGSAPTSWRAEQSRQIDALLAWADRLAGPRDPVAILGDLNCGPAAPGKLDPRWPDDYSRFIERGFTDPFAMSPDVKCSWCYDNRLQGGTSPNGTLIDHILLLNAGDALRAQRIFDHPIEIETSGTRIETAYSDHYGVEVVLDRGG